MAEQPEMKDFRAGDVGKQEGVMRLQGACLMSPFHFPNIPLSPRTSYSTIIYAFFSLGNEVNLGLQNQGQNNFVELECVQETSHNLSGSDFSMEMIVLLQIQAYTPPMWGKTINTLSPALSCQGGSFLSALTNATSFLMLFSLLPSSVSPFHEASSDAAAHL